MSAKGLVYMFTGEEMKKIKHPFDKGIKAVKGLDY